jgi:nicotinamide riboside kinase
MREKMTTYINLYGGPGVGKSTLAAELFARFKKQGKSVELVTEFAKDLVWENRQDTLQIQPYVSMKQFRNLSRLKGKVDFVITDSPLIKDSVYARLYAPDLPEAYYELLAFLHTNLGDSINILLTREYMYDTQGRFQTEEEAVTIDAQIKYALESNDIDYFECSPSIDEVLEAVHQG